MPVYGRRRALLAMFHTKFRSRGRLSQGRFIMGHAGWDFHFDVLYCLNAHPNLWGRNIEE